MKTLKNHIVLFDAECPICKAYTNALVKTGMLDDEGRNAYQNTTNNACPVIDKQRAANEIALVNLQNGEVTYGIKSLFIIIGNAYPFLGPLFSFRPFIWVMGKVYAFIAFNRRVIMPPPATASGQGYIYQPAFKIHYRIIYLLLSWLCTGYILTAYAHLLTGIVPLGSPLQAYMICGGLFVLQGIIISTFAPNKLWSYLGNMATITVAGSLLLLLLLVLGHIFKLTPLFFAVCFMGVSALMLSEHIRRVKLLNLGWLLTFTWVFYGIVLLVFILW